MTLRILPLALLAIAAATSVNAETVFIDFGPSSEDAVTAGWNNLGPQQAVHTMGAVALVNSAGQPTGISVAFPSPFNGTNAAGADSAPDLPFPVTAVQDSLYGNALPWSSGWISKDQPLLPVVEFTGLNPAKLYTFTYFASRKGGPNRSTDYTLDNGGYTTVATLDAASNTDRVALSAPIQPSSDGKLTLKLTPGEANATPQKFVYLGLLKIESKPAQ